MQYVRLEFGVAVIPEVPAADIGRVVMLPILDGNKEYARPVYLFQSILSFLSKVSESDVPGATIGKTLSL